jgi:hypothetical protein
VLYGVDVLQKCGLKVIARLSVVCIRSGDLARADNMFEQALCTAIGHPSHRMLAKGAKKINKICYVCPVL